MFAESNQGVVLSFPSTIFPNITEKIRSIVNRRNIIIIRGKTQTINLKYYQETTFQSHPALNFPYCYYKCYSQKKFKKLCHHLSGLKRDLNL